MLPFSFVENYMEKICCSHNRDTIRDADNGIGDGTRYEYLYEVDAFIEKYDGDDMDCVSPDIFGMYEMGIDMSWVLA